MIESNPQTDSEAYEATEAEERLAAMESDIVALEMFKTKATNLLDGLAAAAVEGPSLLDRLEALEAVRETHRLILKILENDFVELHKAQRRAVASADRAESKSNRSIELSEANEERSARFDWFVLVGVIFAIALAMWALAG